MNNKPDFKNGRAYWSILTGDLFIVHWKQNIPRNSLEGKYKHFWVRIPLALFDYWNKGGETYLLVLKGVYFFVVFVASISILLHIFFTL